MFLAKISGEWWIVHGKEKYGPYSDSPDGRQEAQQDLAGLRRFYFVWDRLKTESKISREDVNRVLVEMKYVQQ